MKLSLDKNGTVVATVAEGEHTKGDDDYSYIDFSSNKEKKELSIVNEEKHVESEKVLSPRLGAYQVDRTQHQYDGGKTPRFVIKAVQQKLTRSKNGTLVAEAS